MGHRSKFTQLGTHEIENPAEKIIATAGQIMQKKRYRNRPQKMQLFRETLSFECNGFRRTEGVPVNRHNNDAEIYAVCSIQQHGAE
jgi:hypothetical protein